MKLLRLLLAIPFLAIALPLLLIAGAIVKVAVWIYPNIDNWDCWRV